MAIEKLKKELEKSSEQVHPDNSVLCDKKATLMQLQKDLLV
jgi:hypothetical protein